MSSLTDFVKERDRTSPFMKFVSGEAVQCTYKGASVVDDTFNPGKQTVQYTVVVDKVEKTFKSGSAGLARQMVGIKAGDEIVIKREGESFKTRWTVGKTTETNEGLDALLNKK
jgi:hypothetical protein